MNVLVCFKNVLYAGEEVRDGWSVLYSQTQGTLPEIEGGRLSAPKPAHCAPISSSNLESKAVVISP